MKFPLHFSLWLLSGHEYDVKKSFKMAITAHNKKNTSDTSPNKLTAAQFSKRLILSLAQSHWISSVFIFNRPI